MTPAAAAAAQHWDRVAANLKLKLTQPIIRITGPVLKHDSRYQAYQTH
jgi:hypothetical protein